MSRELVPFPTVRRLGAPSVFFSIEQFKDIE